MFKSYFTPKNMAYRYTFSIYTLPMGIVGITFGFIYPPLMTPWCLCILSISTMYIVDCGFKYLHIE